MALADGECNGLENSDTRLSCFFNKVIFVIVAYLLLDTGYVLIDIFKILI